MSFDAASPAPGAQDVRVALQAFIYDADGWLLVRESPTSGWCTLGGHLQRDEPVDAGLLREIHEELGPDFNVHIERTVDAHTYDFPTGERYLSIFKLVRHLGGEISLGSDLTGWEARWWTTAELTTLLDAPSSQIIVPQQRWIVEWAQVSARVLHPSPYP